MSDDEMSAKLLDHLGGWMAFTMQHWMDALMAYQRLQGKAAVLYGHSGSYDPLADVLAKAAGWLRAYRKGAAHGKTWLETMGLASLVCWEAADKTGKTLDELLLANWWANFWINYLTSDPMETTQ